jgi:hypothetical protein
MRNRIGRTILLVVVSWRPAGLLWGQPQPAGKQPGMETRERYQGSVTVLKNGKPVQVRGAIRQITLPGHQQVTQLPAQGFSLMQLRGGSLTILINGKEEKHVSGDFWVVPANAKVSLTATGETATVEMISLSVP